MVSNGRPLTIPDKVTQRRVIKQILAEAHRPLSAAEYKARLENDPVYAKMPNERKALLIEKAFRIERESRPVIEALAKIGVNVSHLEEMKQHPYVPLSKEVVQVLLDYLPRVEYVWLQEVMVRLLAATKVKYDARPLAALFDTSDNFYLKWPIGSTLECTKPMNIEDWILPALLNREHGQAREMLCIAAAKILSTKAVPVLREVFDELPGYAAMGLGLCGGPDEANFLRMKSTEAKDWREWVYRKMDIAIRKIEKRFERRSDAGG